MFFSINFFFAIFVKKDQTRETLIKTGKRETT